MTQAESDPAVAEQGSNPMDGPLPDVRPVTVLALFSAGYAKSSRLELAARDAEAITTARDDQDREAEIALVRREAPRDVLLRSLASVIQPIAAYRRKHKDSVRDRVVDLTFEALALHPVFAAWARELEDPQHGVTVSGARVWERAGKVGKDLSLPGLKSALTLSQVERLQVNAVSIFALYRVLRGHWGIDDFVRNMEPVWRPPDAVFTKSWLTAGFLVGISHEQREKLGALDQVLRAATQGVEASLERMTANAEFNTRRAIDAEEAVKSLEGKVAKLEAELISARDDVRHVHAQLAAERERGSIARSHHADDFESLRTRVLRQLAKQSDLLGDGLHALRNGSLGVAEEFVDRAQAAIQRELADLRELEEE